MKEEFPGWFGKQIRQRHIDNDPGVSESSELFALACGPSQTPISVNSCVVNGVRFVMHSCDERRTTQNNSICSSGPDREMYYDGQSIDVDVPPNTIDIVDEDDDIIDEEDPVLHDLTDSDDKDLVNLDIYDGVNVPTGCGGCLGNRGKGTREPNLDGRRAGRLHTRQETQNLRLKAITDKSGPVLIRFKFGDRETLMPLGDHAAHWANYLRELVREFSLHYPSWRQMPPERKAVVVAKIEIESSATQEYPSPIHTFFLTHNVGGVFLNSVDKALYDEMLSLQGLGSNTPADVPYTEDEIIAIIHGDKQRGHIFGVGRVLPGQGTVIPPSPPCTHSSNLESRPKYGGGSGSGGCGDDEPRDDEDGSEDGEDEDDKLVILVNIDLYLADNASFVTSERIPFELFRSTNPGRHATSRPGFSEFVAGESASLMDLSSRGAFCGHVYTVTLVTTEETRLVGKEEL
uniref:Uncharacterized protein n=1 Tax=Tanacetum cinerariifolium TaxID=118510 RepID=A0A6L2JBC5_TANCI|nr:hypothetical protein [Tanacetum cinerariifolium]